MQWTHNDTLEKTAQLTQNPQLKHRVSELFLIALATGLHRGLTPISNFYAMWQIPPHDFVPLEHDPARFRYTPQSVPCGICGLTQCHDPITSAGSLAYGNTHLKPWYQGYFDLNSIAQLHARPENERNASDKLLLQPYQPAHAQALKNLLHFLEGLHGGEAASKLPGLISKAKILPKSNNASRLWTLRILAQLGILRSRAFPAFAGGDHFYPHAQYHAWEMQMHSQFGLRADPVFPFSLCKGGDGINWPQAQKIFPQIQS